MPGHAVVGRYSHVTPHACIVASMSNQPNYVFDSSARVAVSVGDRVTVRGEYGTVRTIEPATDAAIPASRARVVVAMDSGSTWHAIASDVTVCGFYFDGDATDASATDGDDVSPTWGDAVAAQRDRSAVALLANADDHGWDNRTVGPRAQLTRDGSVITMAIRDDRITGATIRRDGDARAIARPSHVHADVLAWVTAPVRTQRAHVDALATANGWSIATVECSDAQIADVTYTRGATEVNVVFTNGKVTGANMGNTDAAYRTPAHPSYRLMFVRTWLQAPGE